MKYLDPETHGAPIKEETFYKEFHENTGNDIKQMREKNPKQDMANNTFIKLFQNNTESQDHHHSIEAKNAET